MQNARILRFAQDDRGELRKALVVGVRNRVTLCGLDASIRFVFETYANTA
jgi:hypothetical protein